MLMDDGVSNSQSEIAKSARNSESRLGQIFVAIKEMDDAQRFKLEQIHERLKHISNMTNWCGLAALVYVVKQAILFFR